MRALFTAWIALAACAEPDSTLFLRSVWDANEVAIALVLDANGAPLDVAPAVILPGDAASINAPITGAYQIFVAAYAPSSELERCAVAIGEGDQPLGPPLRAWRSFLLDEETEASFTLDPNPPLFDLRFHRCTPTADECPGVTVERISGGPLGAQLHFVAPFDAELAFFGGQERSIQNTATMFGRIDGTHATELPPIPNLESEMRGLAFTAQGTLIGAAFNGGIFQAASDGTILRTATVATEILEIATGRDGTSMILSKSATTLELNEGSNALTPRLDFPTNGRHIIVVRKDLIAHFGQGGAIDVLDGAQFRRESEGGDSPEYAAAAGDEEILAVMPRYLPGLLRDPVSRTWRSIARPFESFVNSMTAVRGGRLLAVGRDGAIALYQRERDSWCKIPVDSILELNDVSATPDGRVAFAVGKANSETEPPIMLRILLPE